VQEAQRHAAEDAKRKEAVEINNKAESAIFSAEKLLREYADKLPEDAKKQTQEKIEAVRTAQQNNNIESIQSATDALMQYIQTLGGQMYQQPGATPDGGSGKQGPDEDVVDAEFTEA